MYQPFETFQISGRLISVIGSGGKTSFLRYLSMQLKGSIILTTSTHIFPFAGIPLVDAGSAENCTNRDRIVREIRSALARNRVICLGQTLASGKLSSPASVIPFEDLLREADYVLVEADGSAGRPLKAHRSWEPVIPECSDMTVCMVGASGIGKAAFEACHCPELFCAIAGIFPDRPIDEEHVARVINQEDLADCYLVNQIDTLASRKSGLDLCEMIRKNAGMCSLLSYESSHYSAP